MKKDFVEKQKKKLLEMREQILTKLKDRHEEAAVLASTSEPGDEVDVASTAIDGNLLNELSDHETRRLNMINNALDRIQQNTYGRCLLCEKNIPEARLVAIPYAPLCVDCQTQEERRAR